MNKILSIGLSLVMLIVTACSKSEVVEDDSCEEVKSFIVDYAVATEFAESRNISEGLSPYQRISSLYYLLYDSEGTLLKTRPIPDINESTVWPLKRETMTWQQRQALKDTLMEKVSYTAVMLANVNPETVGIFRGKELLLTSELILPNVAYQDNTMPYIWKGLILYNPIDGADSREYPLKKKITLKRILSRLDIKGLNIAATAVPFSSEFENQLKVEIKDCLIEELNRLKTYPGLNGGTLSLESYVNRLEALMTTDEYLNKIYSRMPKTEIQNEVAADSEFKNRNEWTRFTTFTLKVQQPHNVFGIESLSSRHDGTISCVPVSYDLKNGIASWLGFSGNSAAGESNKIVSITLGGSAGESLDILFDTPYGITLKKNERRELECNPTTSVSAQGETATWTTKMTFNSQLSEVYGDDAALGSLLGKITESLIAGEDKTNMVNAIKEVLKYNITEGFTFTIKIPSTFSYTATIGEKN